MFDPRVFCEKKLDASHLRVRDNFSGEEKKEKRKEGKVIFFSEERRKIQSHHKQQ